MKLTVTAFQTLDGVMQAPGGPEEDSSGGFEHGGWLVPPADSEMGAFMDETFAAAEAFLLGRFTYETFARYWPKVDGADNPVAAQLNALPKHVASRTLHEEDLDWAGSSLLGDDVPAQVAELKARPGGLGTGKRLFDEGAVPAAVRLTESRTTSAGIVIAVYAFQGRPSYGS